MRFSFSIFFLLFSFAGSTQADSVCSSKYITDVMRFLTSDSMEGRKNYSPELQRAALFIAQEFAHAGLKVLPGDSSFLQPFSTRKLKDGMKKESNGLMDATKVLYNVIGYLPADTPTTETIIFSAHYDHIGRRGKRQVYNGANDNASGTTAILALAKYYASKENKKRNIIFCAFAGEELGLYGSQNFLRKIRPEKIVAVINIEMIAVPGPAGESSFFITGAQFSNLERMVQKNLGEQKNAVVGEPDEKKQLFFRSDNFPFAQQGIPAHSFMSSDDDDPCYHSVCDDMSRVDMPHMQSVINLIAKGVRSLIFENEKPQRINVDNVKVVF